MSPKLAFFRLSHWLSPIGIMLGIGDDVVTIATGSSTLSQIALAEKRRDFNVMSPTEADCLVAEEIKMPMLIDGMIPAEGLGIMGGDSTIGKSPLAMQMALCIASGKPFLGKETKPSRVLYFDLENSLADSVGIRNQLAKFLDLNEVPENFLLVTDLSNKHSLDDTIKEFKPQLVIIDALRSYLPSAEKDNEKAGELFKSVKRLTRAHKCFMLFLHHLRKPNPDKPSPLLSDELPVKTWMLDMAGARALVNQSDVRMAVEDNSDSNGVKVKWNRRVHGDSPLYIVERVLDEDGEPFGYLGQSGVGRLNPELALYFGQLGEDFRFSEAKALINKADPATSRFINKLVSLDIVTKLSKGHYRKLVGVGEGAWKKV
jgi:hypothetical protein